MKLSEYVDSLFDSDLLTNRDYIRDEIKALEKVNESVLKIINDVKDML